MKKQAGFTLIEMVVVIIILGILAVTAVPKFIDLQTDARESAMQGILGAVKGASNLAHAKILVDGTASGATVAIEGVTVTNTNGYPDAASVCALVDLDGVTTDTIDCATAAGSLTISDTAAATPANCAITYTEAAAGNSPAITMDLSDC